MTLFCLLDRDNAMSDACEPLREWGGENWRGEEGVGVISFQGGFF